jgi:hypothetical protein
LIDESNRHWWLLVLRGVCAILFGLLSFLWPAMTLASLVLLFGAYSLINGIFAIAMAGRAPRGSPGKAATAVLGLLTDPERRTCNSRAGEGRLVREKSPAFVTARERRGEDSI